MKKINEAPIEMDPQDPMNPMIYGHQGANPAKLKDRMMRASGQLKDLAQRAQTDDALSWEGIARNFNELAMNIEQIRHAIDELANKRKKGGVMSRGIDKNIGEISRGDYHAKAQKSKGDAIVKTMFADPAKPEVQKAMRTIKNRDAGIARAGDRNRKELQAKADLDRKQAQDNDRKNLPDLMKQYQQLVGKFKELGGDSYQYADRMMPRDREAQQVHQQLRTLQARINSAGGKLSENFNPEYDDEAGMAHNSLETIYRATKGLADTIKEGDNLPEWCQEKLSLAEDYLVTVWDYLKSEQAIAEEAKHGLYYNVNKRKKAGTSRSASSPKAPTAQAWKDAAKTAKKEGVAETSIQELKKGVKAAVKPRNFVAKNASTGGAGAHKDKKKDAKQGKTKHKKAPELAESATYDRRLNVLLGTKLLTEQIRTLNK
jgi:chaperonin cofactor prefoldin